LTLIRMTPSITSDYTECYPMLLRKPSSVVDLKFRLLLIPSVPVGIFGMKKEKARKEKEGRKNGKKQRGNIDCTAQQRWGYVTVRAIGNAA